MWYENRINNQLEEFGIFCFCFFWNQLVNSELRVVPRRGDDQRESQQPYYKPLVRVVRNKGTLRLFCLPLTRRAELSWAELRRTSKEKGCRGLLFLLISSDSWRCRGKEKRQKGHDRPSSPKNSRRIFIFFTFLHNNNNHNLEDKYIFVRYIHLNISRAIEAFTRPIV